MRDDVGESLKAVLDYIGGRESKGDRFVDELKEAVGKAKMRKEWRREYMTLYMRDQENIERGIEQGIERGMSEGIKGMVSAFRDMGVSDEYILEKLKEKFAFGEAEARKFLQIEK